MLVDRLLRESAQVRADAQALVCGQARLTYGELDEAADRVAAGLCALGVLRGCRVAVHLENTLEAVLTMSGALRAGAIFVPINPTMKAEKLGYVLRDCEPTVLVSERRAWPAVAEALQRQSVQPAALVLTGANDAELPPRTLSFESLARSEPDGACRDVRIDLDLAALIYTSGSTGRPKGVMLSHANIVAATTSINAYIGNTWEDVILDVLPLSFDYGLYQLFLAFQSGASVVLERSFVYPSLMLELSARERVTGLPIVPMMAALLLRHEFAGYDLSSLRYVTNTGAALPSSRIAALRARLPHVRIFSMYGLTECKRVSYLDPALIDARPTSVGKPMDNVEVFLIDDDGTRIDRGVGELVVRGANVMQGYWRAPEDTARALRPGVIPGEQVLHTGDIFEIDEDGFMYFRHRLDDIIKSRGQKVSPREIEDVLLAVPGVQEALVAGAPDPMIGEALQAYVTLLPGVQVSEQDLQLHCSKHLEDFMVPRSIAIVASLPHTTSGKLVRRSLTPATAC